MSEDHTYPSEVIMHIILNNGEMVSYLSSFGKAICHSSRIFEQGARWALVGVRASKFGRTGEALAD